MFAMPWCWAGVYIGAWQEHSNSQRSAYSVLGSSLSALAARVANSYGITGPAITVNTACSRYILPTCQHSISSILSPDQGVAPCLDSYHSKYVVQSSIWIEHQHADTVPGLWS